MSWRNEQFSIYDTVRNPSVIDRIDIGRYHGNPDTQPHTHTNITKYIQPIYSTYLQILYCTLNAVTICILSLTDLNEYNTNENTTLLNWGDRGGGGMV
jgi:hypothetical protein